MGTGEWSIKLGEWLGHYSRMQKLKAVRWEHFGIGLGLNFELVFATVKSRRQVTPQVWSSGQMSGPEQRFGCWLFRQASSHCGRPRVSGRGSKRKRGDLTGILGSVHLQGSIQKVESHCTCLQGSEWTGDTAQGHLRYLLLKGRGKTEAEAWAFGQPALECSFGEVVQLLE